MKAELISKTIPTGTYFGEVQNTEELMAAVARVSSGKPPEARTEDAEKLLTYCLKHGHWSVFEHSTFTIRMELPLYLTMQVLRHWSARFSQFSARYNVLSPKFCTEMRKAGSSNRQGSTDILLPEAKQLATKSMMRSYESYLSLLEKGVAQECARKVLPLGIYTELFMTSNARNWIHYLQQRLDKHSQKEHRTLAAHVCDVLRPELPILFNYFNW